TNNKGVCVYIYDNNTKKMLDLHAHIISSIVNVITEKKQIMKKENLDNKEMMIHDKNVFVTIIDLHPYI
ncbi:hypothetical protein ACJX0J_010320, partial [Zea mays]